MLMLLLESKSCNNMYTCNRYALNSTVMEAGSFLLEFLFPEVISDVNPEHRAKISSLEAVSLKIRPEIVL